MCVCVYIYIYIYIMHVCICNWSHGCPLTAFVSVMYLSVCLQALTGRSVSNSGPMIDVCFARVCSDVAPRKWDWTHVKKHD